MSQREKEWLRSSRKASNRVYDTATIVALKGAVPRGSRNPLGDPLFYGWSRGWGSWYQGEITAEWLLFNGNQVNHMVHLTAHPRADSGLGAIYYDFDLVENHYFGTPVSDQDFTQELNAYADCSLTDRVSLSVLYGVAFPGTAAEQAFGGEQPYHVVEGYVSVPF